MAHSPTLDRRFGRAKGDRMSDTSAFVRTVPIRDPVGLGPKWPRLAWTRPVATGDFQEFGIDPGASVSPAAMPTG